MFGAGSGRTHARKVRIGSAPLVCGGLLMTWLTHYFAGADDAAAASRNIRLRAYVPVRCMLKHDPGHHGVYRRPALRKGNFKVVCNTPYHMHMQGHWEPARWPGVFPFHRAHAQKDLGVEVRLVGQERTLDGRCDLTPGPDGGCRAFDDEGGSPPRLAQAQITVDMPWAVGPRRAKGRISMMTGVPFRVAALERTDVLGSEEARWSGRMSLGGLPRIASAEEIPYVPRYLSDVSARDAPEDILARGDEAGDDAAADTREHITVYLTLTGRY